MSKKYFPAKDKGYTYLQTNRSDDLGSLWSTMGIDLQSNLGTMRVAPRLRISTSTADDADLGLPVAFEFADTYLWAICGSRVFKNGSSPNSSFAEDASGGAVTTYNENSDLEVFNGLLWSTTVDTLYRKALNGSGTGAWTSNGSIGNTAHPLVNFKKFNRLYVPVAGTPPLICSVDSSNTLATSGDYTISLGLGETVSCMKAASNTIFIGISAVSNTMGNVAKVVTWDGISPQITNEYFLKSRYVVAMTIDNDIPYIMDGNGVLSRFEGSTFKELGRLPFTTKLPLVEYICKNGMIVTKNNTVLVVVNNQNRDSEGSIYENIPSGVWEWSEEFGFTHKYAFTYNTSSTSTITDYGQNRISAAGAIFSVSSINPTVSGANGSILIGSTYYTNASSTSSAIFIDDSLNTIQKKGYFVTTWFSSDEIQDTWSRLWATYRRFLASNDSIVFKYRLNEEEPTYADITWVNTTSFTTTTDISAYDPTASGFNGTTGGEVEIIQGTGSASCVHITSIVNNAGTYTVTVDTAVTGVTTGTAKARFQKWIKLNPSVPLDQINSYMQTSIGGSNIRIQIKGCMTFTGNDEFYKMVLVSNEDIKETK